MIKTLFATVLLSLFVAPSAFAGPINWPFPTQPQPPPSPQPIAEHGTCTIVTEGLVTIPGLAANPKETTLRAKTAKLTSQLDPAAGVINLFVQFDGQDVNQKPLSQIITAPLGVQMGSDYRVFTYRAKNRKDEISSVEITMEVYERIPKAHESLKGLMSVLVRSKAVDPRTKKSFLRTTSTRFFCDDLKQM